MKKPEEWPILAHADFGADDCDGCLFPVITGDRADITCNSCGAVVRSVPVEDLQRTFDEMELSLESCATEMCPHCRHVNVFPGWQGMMAYTCEKCGVVVRLSDDPNVDRIFGAE
jgi:hypothetical protein